MWRPGLVVLAGGSIPSAGPMEHADADTEDDEREPPRRPDRKAVADRRVVARGGRNVEVSTVRSRETR